MKIGLNATCFNNRPSGAKQRFIGLYGELFKKMSYADFVIFEPADATLKDWFPQLDNIKFKKTIIPSEGRVEKYLLGLRFWKNFLKDEKIDFIEGFNLPNIDIRNVTSFQTIHDIRSVYSDFPILERSLSKVIHLNSINSCDHIITVSESMRNEIIQFAPSANVSVIYNGINEKEFRNISDTSLSTFKKKFNLPNQFLLSIGHFETRKNYYNLIEAIKILKNRGISYPLLIVGNDNGDKKRILNKIRNDGLDNQIYLYSGLSNNEVKYLYKLAFAFVFPSVYEGFGIPILESMASSTPLILSDLPVFKEIAKDHAVFFDPYDIESIADSIHRLLEDSTLLEKLKFDGSNRLKDFSFHQISKKLELLYSYYL